MLQGDVSEEGPEQSLPPFAGRGLLHCLVLEIVPPPHVTPQEVHMDQPPQFPLTGQELVLQGDVSEDGPEQSLPPFAGRGLLHCLVLEIVPPPHVTPQEVHPDQRPQLPSTKKNAHVHIPIF